MGALEKYNRTVAKHILRHNARENKNYKNKDIDPERSENNISIIDKGYAGYKNRLEELYVFNRKDVKTLCQWVITLPEPLNKLSEDNQIKVMNSVSDFLRKRYGDDNCIQSILHCDEKGQPHLHFAFIPVVEDKKKHKESGKKVDAKKVLTRHELQVFHRDLAMYINKKYPMRRYGRHFHTGVTKANGGNLTVEQLKILESNAVQKDLNFELMHNEQDICEYQQTVESLYAENKRLKAKIAELEHKQNYEYSKSITEEFEY